jgi:hypothetical protein
MMDVRQSGPGPVRLRRRGDVGDRPEAANAVSGSPWTYVLLIAAVVLAAQEHLNIVLVLIAAALGALLVTMRPMGSVTAACAASPVACCAPKRTAAASNGAALSLSITGSGSSLSPVSSRAAAPQRRTWPAWWTCPGSDASCLPMPLRPRCGRCKRRRSATSAARHSRTISGCPCSSGRERVSWSVGSENWCGARSSTETLRRAAAKAPRASQRPIRTPQAGGPARLGPLPKRLMHAPLGLGRLSRPAVRHLVQCRTRFRQLGLRGAVCAFIWGVGYLQEGLYPARDVLADPRGAQIAPTSRVGRFAEVFQLQPRTTTVYAQVDRNHLAI